MSIRDYEDELRTNKRDLNAVICVYQKPGFSSKSPVNRMLEKLVAGLKGEMPDYESIQIAYVYETRGLQNVLPFETVTSHTEPYYMEPIRDMADHSLDHVFFMGMALLEQAKAVNNGECRLYLVTDARFEHVNEVYWKDEEAIILNPRFAKMNPKVYIYKAENAGGEELEQLIKNQTGGNVEVIS